MRLDAIGVRSVQSVERSVSSQSSNQTQLTPARRAVLDALEREFHDLLNAVPLGFRTNIAAAR